MDDAAPLDPNEARLRPTYAIVSLSRLRAKLAAVKAHAAPARTGMERIGVHHYSAEDARSSSGTLCRPWPGAVPSRRFRAP
jgi:hypothetical protein